MPADHKTRLGAKLKSAEEILEWATAASAKDLKARYGKKPPAPPAPAAVETPAEDPIDYDALSSLIGE